MQETYMSSGLQAARRESILVEAGPLFKGSLRAGLRFLGVPDKHLGGILHSDAVAEALDDAGRVVEEVVCVDHADFDTFTRRSAIRSVRSIRSIGGAVATVGFAVLDASVVRMAWPN